MSVNIEDAREEMLGQIEEIEKLCFSVPWTLEQLRSQLKDPQHEFIAALDPEGRVLGYVGMMYVLDEGYISNVAVAPEARRRGIGRALIRELMERAAALIGDTYGCAVLVKGGHQLNDANDLLYRGGRLKWFRGKRIHNPNTHGTGCTLSSAIASNLAKGMNLKEAVRRAKNYISGALAAGLDLGKGSGPMDHGFAVKGEYEEEIR